ALAGLRGVVAMERWALRLRVFLFFAFLASGALLVAGGAMLLAWSRSDPAVPAAPFLTAFVIFAILNTGVIVAIWLLFDENVAKPINRLSADLRMRAHADVTDKLETETARYLGDLAPAAAALTDKAASNVEDTAAQIARETNRLGAEQKRLAALLTESPIATILTNPAGEIVLYDAQAASILSEIAPPRLKAPMEDYFEPSCLTDAYAMTEASQHFDLRPRSEGSVLKARVKALGEDGHMFFIDPPVANDGAAAARPLVFDFDLMHAASPPDLKDQRLSELCYVVLDLETTGLSVTQDAVVQIGAVRVVNGSQVPGEELSTFVDPCRPIPPASTRIHRVTDTDVKGAPPISVAGRTLHNFSSGAVLVAHNAPFDIGLLKRFAAEAKVEWTHPVLDTVLLSAVAFGTTEEHSLDALCERLSVTIFPEDRHTALGDARVTAAALVRLLPMLEGMGYTTFGALQPELERQARRLYAIA
ncbi:MAG: exonuclease domain-containing protein, partial [Pseudomonadota bacterium]